MLPMPATKGAKKCNRRDEPGEDNSLPDRAYHRIFSLHQVILLKKRTFRSLKNPRTETSAYLVIEASPSMAAMASRMNRYNGLKVPDAAKAPQTNSNESPGRKGAMTRPVSKDHCGEEYRVGQKRRTSGQACLDTCQGARWSMRIISEGIDMGPRWGVIKVC